MRGRGAGEGRGWGFLTARFARKFIMFMNSLFFATGLAHYFISFKEVNQTKKYGLIITSDHLIS